MASQAEHERRFELFGSEVRLLLGAPADACGPPPELTAIGIEAFLRALERRLTRFDPDSELSRLNGDPRATVPVSAALARAVAAAIAAASETDGLVDPVVLDALEANGYERSRAGRRAGPLVEALSWAPERAPARAAPGQSWRAVHVESDPPAIARPPGMRLDLGGSGKGLAADLAAERLTGYESFVVDAGGDVRLGGQNPPARTIEVGSPFEQEACHSFELATGAVATSGLRTRVWRDGDGFAHHLIDPASGRPAWTGVVQATAVAPTAASAETYAKAALLLGPVGGRELLEAGGGVLVLDDGDVVLAGSLASATPGRSTLLTERA